MLKFVRVALAYSYSVLSATKKFCCDTHEAGTEHTIVPSSIDLILPEKCEEHDLKIQFYIPDLQSYGCEECRKKKPVTHSDPGRYPGINGTPCKDYKESMKILQDTLTFTSGQINQWFDLKKEYVSEKKILNSGWLSKAFGMFKELHRKLELAEHEMTFQTELLFKERRKRNESFVTEMNMMIFTLNGLKGSIEDAQAKLKAGCKDVKIDEFEITRVKESIDLNQLRSTEWILSANVVFTPGDSLQNLVQVQVNQDWMALQKPNDNPSFKAQLLDLQPEQHLSKDDKVFITHMDTPTHLYVMRITDKREYLKLTNQVQYLPLERVQDPLTACQLVLVKGMRAKILSIDEARENVKVVCIDSGKNETVPVKLVFNLVQKYKDVKPFAIQCHLRNVEVIPDWKTRVQQFKSDPNTKKLFSSETSRLKGQSAIMIEGEDSGFDVELEIEAPDKYFHYGSTTLTDLLIFHKLVLPTKSRQVPATLPYPYSHFEYKKGSDANVQVAGCADIDSIYVHKPFKLRKKWNNNNFKYFPQNPHHRTSQTEETLLVPMVNSACWYMDTNNANIKERALVTRILNDKKVEVFLVDIGSYVICPYSMLKLMDQASINQECFLNKVSLFDLAGVPNLTKQRKEALVTFLKGTNHSQLVKIHIEEDPVNCIQPQKVSMYIVFSDVVLSINALLIYLNLAVSVNGFHTQLKFPMKSTRNSQPFYETRLRIEAFKNRKWEKSGSSLEDPLQVMQPGQVVKCKISSIFSPYRIFVLPEKFEPYRLNLNQDLSDMIRKNGEYHTSVVPGQLCAAKTRLGFYARGIILQNKGSSCEVFFVDSGEIEDCSIQFIFNLPDLLKKIPSLVVCVHVSGISPAGGKTWSKTAVESFIKEVKKYPSFLLKVTGPVVNAEVAGRQVNSVPVNITVEDIEFSFDEISTPAEPVDIAQRSLVKRGLAFPAKGESELTRIPGIESLTPEQAKYYQPSNFDDTQSLNVDPACVGKQHLNSTDLDWTEPVYPSQPSSRFQAFITTFNQDGTVYLQTTEQQQKLKDISSGLDARFKGSWTRFVDNFVNVGDPVIVNHSNKWYRGKILAVKSVKEVQVELVDYGHLVSVELTQVRRHLAFTEISLQRYRAKLKKEIVRLSKAGKFKLESLVKNSLEAQITVKLVKKDCLDIWIDGVK